MITRFMEHTGSDKLLLFSTDYTHWQFQGTAIIPEGPDPVVTRKTRLRRTLA